MIRFGVLPGAIMILIAEVASKWPLTAEPSAWYADKSLPSGTNRTSCSSSQAAATFEGGAGAVLAGKTPLGRLGRVTDIAPLAVFLASDESASITG